MSLIMIEEHHKGTLVDLRHADMVYGLENTEAGKDILVHVVVWSLPGPPPATAGALAGGAYGFDDDSPNASERLPCDDAPRSRMNSSKSFFFAMIKRF